MYDSKQYTKIRHTQTSSMKIPMLIKQYKLILILKLFYYVHKAKKKKKKAPKLSQNTCQSKVHLLIFQVLIKI